MTATQKQLDSIAAELSRRTRVPLYADLSENGDEHWKCPIFVATDVDTQDPEDPELPDCYALCDLESGTLEAQLDFLEEQIREGLPHDWDD
jgi:hypothetical protein